MFIHHTKNKGDLGVLKAKLDLFSKGYLILNPESEHSPFDIVGYKDGVFIRVQVKYRKSTNGSVVVKNSTNWADKNGSHVIEYSKEEIDFFCIYVPDLDLCFYVNVKMFENKKCLNFRSEKSISHNKDVRYISNYLNVK